MPESVVTPAAASREPTEADIQATRAELDALSREASDLLYRPEAASLHCALGRIYFERLGDARSAAVCWQNAFQIDATHRATIEAARQMFLSAGRFDRALALHEREEALLTSPAERAESLRAQAAILLRQGQPAEASRRIQRALQLAPDHPALLAMAVETAGKGSANRAGLLVRMAEVVQDRVQKAHLLARALTALEDAGAAAIPELKAMHEDALHKLHEADPDNPATSLAFLQRVLAAGDWPGVLQLWRSRATRSSVTADRIAVAHLLAWRLRDPAAALAELHAAPEGGHDPAVLAVVSAIGHEQRSPDHLTAVRARAAASSDASERADLKVFASTLVADPVEQERLLSEALTDSPGDAAAIAQHVRLLARRDPFAAAERFVALGDALAEHLPAGAAVRYLDAATTLERAGHQQHAARLATRLLALGPGTAAADAALRLLQRTAPFLQAQAAVAAVLEQAAAQLQPARAADLLARAAALLSDLLPASADAPHPRAQAQALARRAAELASGTTAPAHLDAWIALALRCGDLASMSVALEMRAASAQRVEAAEYLVEAAELAGAAGDQARAVDLFRRARAADPASEAARRGLLGLPDLPDGERVDLLAQEAQAAPGPQGAALSAERAALLEAAGRLDDAAQACSEAVAQGGADLGVLRRLARVQLRRGDFGAAVDALAQVAAVTTDAGARAETLSRAAEIAEWRANDVNRALELYAAAADVHPGATGGLAQLARLHLWMGHLAQAAQAYEQLAERSTIPAERAEALRWAASLQSRRNPAAAAELWRRVLAQSPADLDAMTALLRALADQQPPPPGTEAADLRSRLAARCTDPRFAALLRIEAAQERMAAGQRDEAVAEYRRALAVNPADRVALDAAEQALRLGGRPELLAEHLAFRCAYADPAHRASLALEQGDLLERTGHLDAAAVAYRQALETDPESRLAKRGAQRVAERLGDRHERAKDGATHGDPSFEPGRLVEAALLAQHLDRDDPLSAPASLRAAPVQAAAVQTPPSHAAAPQSQAEVGSDAESPPEAPLSPESLHELFARARSEGRSDAALCAAAVLWALGTASDEEKSTYEAFAAQAPPAELRQIGDDDRLVASDDSGPARELLRAAAAELIAALPTALTGRGDRVRCDNPVRRVCAAIARALGLEEPSLYVAKREPSVVLPTATTPAGLLVGVEVPKRYQSRQQRFLYARALAHVRRGTHALAALPPDRVGRVVAELMRLVAPGTIDDARLPPADAALAKALAAAISPAARGPLVPLARELAAQSRQDWEQLSFAMRETAERTALVLCGDPGAALKIVIAEASGGLERPEVARLTRFAVSDAYLAVR
jgi:tetratricopeptide (TPR) repeat protein